MKYLPHSISIAAEQIRLFLSVSMLLTVGINAEAQVDSVKAASIDSTVVRITRNTSGLIDLGRGVSFDVSLSEQLPRLLGSSDPLRYIQFLPWVQSTSELDAGIRIYGCDNSHNFVNIDGIPVYGSQHLFGLFSIFMPSHFDKVNVMTQVLNESRLGGEVQMVSKTDIPSRIGGEINVGLMEAEGSFFTNIGKKTALYASVRRSYLNLLYGKFLTLEGVPFVYNMTDANLTLSSQPGRNDQICARFYWGQDNIDCSANNYLLSARDRWGNILGGISWQHSFSGAELMQQIYVTNYRNDADITYSQSSLYPSSSITDLGYTAQMSFCKRMSAGAKFAYYNILPQRSNTAAIAEQNVFEGSLWVSKTHDFYHWLQFVADAKLEYFKGDDKRDFWGFSPAFNLTFRIPNNGKIILGAALRHQYLFQTGVSNLNMPLEFWLSAGQYSDPQRSADVDLQYKLDFLEGQYSFSAGAYYKYLTNQLEYDGQILDLIRYGDSFSQHLLHGDGNNYGASVMLQKNSGKLTGWVSYCYSRAIRYFNGLSQPCPSVHDRPHEFKLVAVYHLKHWDFSGTFICASGTPFTPAKSFYINAGQLICNFAEYNSQRLPAYVRLDLSVNYYFKENHINGLNLSLYNVTCRDNASSYKLYFDAEDNTFSYVPVSMKLFCLPSISYFHKF